MTTPDHDTIRARLDAATPGPWRWGGNTDTNSLRLFSTGERWQRTVMDFVRWGMHGAAPRFQFKGGGMVRADEYVRYEVAPDATDRNDRRVYRADVTAIRHPDADLIAHAPDDIRALLDENARLRAALHRVIAASDETCACCDCRNCRAYNDVMDDVSRSLVVPVSARPEVES